MPWKETRVMDEKIKMLGEYLSGEYTVAEISREHEISRKTVYKWIKRYDNEKESWLEEKSPRPLHSPRALEKEKVGRILALKIKHEHWGGRKLRAWLESHEPEETWPVQSTIYEILKRHGLVQSRRKRQRTPAYTEPFREVTQPNTVWCADYKGQFRLGNGHWCYPLTLTDNFSRYLLGCWGQSHPAYQPTRQNLEAAFREYGLPEAIRTDNGEPFASVGRQGLSRLGVWFIKLGIQPERIAKGHPEQNGRHERMHRTLKAEAINPSKRNLEEQQRAFMQFQAIYNNERPHEGLGQKTPSSAYQKSARAYPAKLKTVEYGAEYEVRQVKEIGTIKWHNTEIYVSTALGGELVGLKELDTGLWLVSYSFYPLGILDQRTMKIL